MLKPPAFGSEAFMADPYPHYKRMREESPVLAVKLAWWLPKLWIVTRYDDVIAFLRDDRLSKNYVKKLWLPRTARSMYRNLLTLDPPDHTRLRSLVQRAFTPRIIEQMTADIQRVTDVLLDEAATSENVDLIRDFAVPLPLKVMGDLLGIPSEDRPRFEPPAKRCANAAASVSIAVQLQAIHAAFFFKTYLRELIELRRREPRDDLLSALIRAEEEGDKLTQEEVISMILLLLVAGFETTVHLISNGVLTLLNHPEERLRLQENPDLAESAIEEILRYASPVQFSTPRVAEEDVTIGSTTIPRGALAAASLASANHDETRFSASERFDITRDPNKHLAFGGGPHYCVGAPLARLEGRIALTTLFRRFPDLHLTRTVESLRWKRSLAARGVIELPVTLTPP
jgi:cytochrome P450